MHDLFKSLIHTCCDEWDIGYDHLDGLSSELILPESLQKLIDEIMATKPPKATSSELLAYLDTNPRFSSWRGDVQHGTISLLHIAMDKITY